MAALEILPTKIKEEDLCATGVVARSTVSVGYPHCSAMNSRHCAHTARSSSLTSFTRLLLSCAKQKHDFQWSN